MEDLMKYKLLRISKGIKLSGEIADYVGCKYTLLSMYEHDKTPMTQDKIQRYKFFIDNYEKEGVLIGK